MYVHIRISWPGLLSPSPLTLHLNRVVETCYVRGGFFAGTVVNFSPSYIKVKRLVPLVKGMLYSLSVVPPDRRPGAACGE